MLNPYYLAHQYPGDDVIKHSPTQDCPCRPHIVRNDDDDPDAGYHWSHNRIDVASRTMR